MNARWLLRLTTAAALAASLVTASPFPMASAHAAPGIAAKTKLPKWLSRAASPTDRDTVAAAAGGDGRIYVTGAAMGNEVDAYDPRANAWTTVAPIPTGRWGLAMAAGADGRVYALGGLAGSAATTAVEVYDPAKNTWSTAAPMHTKRMRFAAVTGGDGRIYAIGGSDGWNPYASVEVYDPKKNVWSDVASMSGPREELAAAVDTTGRIYAVGGSDDQGPLLSRVEVYDPAKNAWTTLASLRRAVTWPTALEGADGSIYVIGGFDGRTSGQAGSAVQLYDAAGKQWKFATPLSAGRWMLAAVSGPDGRMYAIGGCSGLMSCDEPTSRMVEAYGPSVTLTPASGKAGSTARISGYNFAASATVDVIWKNPISGQLVGQGMTNARGSLTAPVTFTIPTGITPGFYHVIVVDTTSRYPVTLTFTVTS